MYGKVPKEVVTAFTDYSPDLKNRPAGEIKVEKIGEGLINYSYKVTCENKKGLLLQLINKNVFPKPQDVQENYTNIWQYAEFEFTGLRLPSPKYCGKKTTLFIDENENYWRAFELIENSKTLQIAKKPSQAKATAKAFAKFTAAFEGFNINLLKIVIPNFHNLSFRYDQFEESLNTEMYERMAKAISITNELKKRERYKHFYEIIIDSGEFHLRVMHHDAKITNILFSKESGKVICPVDFDTVMPGYFFSDLGDIIRSMACSHDENSTDYENISIKKKMYEGIIEGYLLAMGKQLTNSEKNYIHYSGLLIIYMQTLRFITDYLNGDIYYQTSYGEQNFDRAKNQLVLLEKLEEFLFNEYRITV